MEPDGLTAAHREERILRSGAVLFPVAQISGAVGPDLLGECEHVTSADEVLPHASVR